MVMGNTTDCQVIDDPFGQASGLCAVRALNPDIAIVHGQAADKYGNTILMPPRGEDIYGVFGSLKGVIVTVEKIVSTDYIRRHSHLVKLPGFLVKSVSEAPMGAHPSGMNTQGLPEIEGYCEDIPFYVEAREAARDVQAFNSWIKKWILDCEDHDAYLRTLGSERVHVLKGRSHPNAWWYDLNGKIPEIANRKPVTSRLERAVLAASDIMRNKALNEDCKLILVGAGLASLAGWVAIYGLKEQGVDAELVSELGFMGFAPRPGEPFLFNLSNIPTCKQLDGIFTVLGMMVPNDKSNCLAALSAAQVDKFGNLNTTEIPEKKIIMTGSGGANDVMSAAKEVLIVMPQSRDRFVEKLPFITSPGARAKTLVSTLGVFEKLGNEGEFTLTAYFEDQLPEQQDLAVREIREQCGWDLKVADNPKRFPHPNETDLITLRMFDPDRYLLKDSE
jgi:acyl CoA:acetate/3-ketoacid CoA transferase beta subunit